MALVTVQRSPRGSTSTANCHCQTTDETDGSGNKEGEENSAERKSASECYFAVKGAALVLPHDECLHVYRQSIANGACDIQQHLQAMFYLLHPDDILKMAVKLESVHNGRIRYLAVVSRTGKLQTEESCLLGIDCNNQTTIGLVLPVWADTRITLDGDGGFSVTSNGRHHIFKPVSVQAMWSALQTLHKASSKARECNYFKCGGTHQWIEYYEKRISSDRSCLNEWHAMDDLESRRPPSPDTARSQPTEREETEKHIRAKLKELMMSVDLDEVTSKYIRTRLEEILDMNLKEFKSFIDQEMLTILGQMDAPTEIFQYLYLGSEWNASNMEELIVNGIGHILNVTREIDNFFPGMFDYQNIRVYDDESTEILHYWDKTYRYIRRAKDEGSKVLVHCKMGISRSASVVIAYVMKAYDWNLQQALDFVKNKRNCIKPNSGFLKQLEIYQGILDASKHRHNSLWRSKSETNLKSSDKPKKSRSEDKHDGMPEKSESLRHLKLPGITSRPKSWSPNDAVADMLFPPNGSLSNETLIRDELRKPKYQSKTGCCSNRNLCFLDQQKEPCNSQQSDETVIEEIIQSSDTLHVESSIPRVSSIKDRINELELHVTSVTDAKLEVIKSPSSQSRSGLVLNLANQFESGSKPSSPVDEGLMMKSTLEEEIVEPVLSQTKLPALKHHAVLVKPALWAEENFAKLCLTKHASNSSSSTETTDVGTKCQSNKAIGFDSAVSCSCKKQSDIPRSGSSVPPVDATSNSLEKASHHAHDLVFKPVIVDLKEDSCAKLEERTNPCPQNVVGSSAFHNFASEKKSAEPHTCISKMQVNGKLHDKLSLTNGKSLPVLNPFVPLSQCKKMDSVGGVSSKPSARILSELCVEQNISSQNVPSKINLIYDKEDIPFTPGTVQRTKQQLEEKNLTRTTSFDSGFPFRARSTPSTPPDHDTVLGKPVRRSHSLRSEHRPTSMFAGKWYPLPALASFSLKPCKSSQEQLSSSLCYDHNTSMVHSVSTPSVVEAVNQVICGTQEVLNSAIQSIPSDKAFSPSSRHTSSDSNFDFGSASSLPDIDVEDVVFTGRSPPVQSESPIPGIVKQQCEILENKAPKAMSCDKSSVENCKGKKETGKILPETSINLVANDPVTKPEDGKDLGLVKRLTKELEAKTSSDLSKKEKISPTSKDGDKAKCVSTSPETDTCRSLRSGPEIGIGPRQATGLRSSLPTSIEKKLSCKDGIQHAPPTPHRKTSLDLNFLRKTTSRFPLTIKLRQQSKSDSSKAKDLEPKTNKQISGALPTLMLNSSQRTTASEESKDGTEPIADNCKVTYGRPPPAVKTNPSSGTDISPPPLSGPPRKMRKQQGSTHPLSKLTIRQRHNNPIYNTM